VWQFYFTDDRLEPDESRRAVSDAPKGSGEGAWIFLSHSNKDFEKVREIRNELEKRGHKPLMFFLKCLESEDARLPDLLKQEIAARQWFLLCDSPNAKASKWVQDEVAMIQAMEGKVVRTVDLEKELEGELHKVVELAKRATVFLSYAQADQEMAARIRDVLLKHGYSVWFDRVSWANESTSALDEAVARGFVLVLMSPASLKNKTCESEIEYAVEANRRTRRSNIFPVVISPFSREEHNTVIGYLLSSIQWLDLTKVTFDKGMEELMGVLKSREME
jgi:hypothetical protein